MDPLTIANLAVQGVGAIGGMITASRQQKMMQERADLARAEMERLRGQYASLDTSNPYLNMENVMEDLTVNQQQAQFEAQQFQQSQANIMGSMREAAGSSGIAALAQTLAQQGQIAAQRSSADIGRQEANIQMQAARQAQYLEKLEREGEIKSRDLRRDQVGTLLGMSQQETAQYTMGAMQAQQAKMDALTGGLTGIGTTLTNEFLSQ